ncbi:MAG: hypothetical protein JWO80_3047 [Bryobacterales bacterium]|nr:hypothetical protein [Bryobacterales bacterium]
MIQKVRYFFRPNSRPDVRRILLVESGSRSLIEGVIPHLVDAFGEVPIDLVTCFAGAPADFPGKVYRVMNYPTSGSRRKLYRELAGNDYQVLGIICSAEPIMTKWKWMLAYRVPAAVFMLNENGDYVWVDRNHAAIVADFVRFRTGLAGAGAVRTIARLLLFPFTLTYLVLYATAVHARRALRQITQ